MQFARAKLFWPQQADCLQQRVLTFYRRVYRSVSIEIVLFGRCVVPAPVFGSYSRIPTHSSVDSILWSLAQSVRPEHRRLWMAFICKSIDAIGKEHQKSALHGIRRWNPRGCLDLLSACPQTHSAIIQHVSCSLPLSLSTSPNIGVAIQWVSHCSGLMYQIVRNTQRPVLTPRLLTTRRLRSLPCKPEHGLRT